MNEHGEQSHSSFLLLRIKEEPEAAGGGASMWYSRKTLEAICENGEQEGKIIASTQKKKGSCAFRDSVTEF